MRSRRKSVLALEELHGHEVPLGLHVLDSAVVEDRDDVRVLEPGEDARLEEEALVESWGRFDSIVCGRQDLDRDLALERDLLAAIDDAHAARREEGVDLELLIQDLSQQRIGLTAGRGTVRKLLRRAHGLCVNLNSVVELVSDSFSVADMMPQKRLAAPIPNRPLV